MDEYDNLRKLYNDFVRGLVPKLSKGRVDEALNLFNGLVGLVRPSDWTVSQVPSEILGMTPERMVIYSGADRLGFYFGLPYAEIHELVLKMAEEVNPYSEEYVKSCEHLESLLRGLETLKKK